MVFLNDKIRKEPSDQQSARPIMICEHPYDWAIHLTLLTHTVCGFLSLTGKVTTGISSDPRDDPTVSQKSTDSNNQESESMDQPQKTNTNDNQNAVPDSARAIHGQNDMVIIHSTPPGGSQAFGVHYNPMVCTVPLSFFSRLYCMETLCFGQLVCSVYCVRFLEVCPPVSPDGLTPAGQWIWGHPQPAKYDLESIYIKGSCKYMPPSVCHDSHLNRFAEWLVSWKATTQGKTIYRSFKLLTNWWRRYTSALDT